MEQQQQQQEQPKEKRTYKARKIVMRNEHKLQSTLDSYFSSSDIYLNYDLANQKIVIDKRIPKNKLNVPPRRRHHQLMQFRHREWNQNSKSTKSILFDMASTSKGNLKSSVKPNRNKVKEIDNNSLNEIYSSFQRKRIENSKSNEDLLQGYSKLVRKQMNSILNSQSQTLKEYTKEKAIDNEICDSISKKIKKPSESLLMSTSCLFRSKQEMKNEIDRELKKKETLFPFKWPHTLRSHCIKGLRFFMNTSEPDMPRWRLNACDKKEEILEKVISPTNVNRKLNEDLMNKKALKALVTNAYINQRVSSPVINNLRKNIIDENAIGNMTIQGRNLLQIEHDIAKQYKGKITIMDNKESNAEASKPIVFYKNWSNPILIKGK